MLYTVGSRLSYLETFRKMAGVAGGEHSKSEGGLVVRSIGEARRLARERFSGEDMGSCGLQAVWDDDTRAVTGGWWHVITRSVPILMLSPDGEPIQWPRGSEEPPDVCRV